MRITTRTTTIAFFITLGVLIAAVAAVLNIGWVILNWREVVPLVLGVIFFPVIIAGVILNTIFLVREIRLNAQHDAFINAVTHELKTPVASIRLYLETLLAREVGEAKRKEFYATMLADCERQLALIEQVLRAGRMGASSAALMRVRLDFNPLIGECLDRVRVLHKLAPDRLRYEPGAASEGTFTDSQ